MLLVSLPEMATTHPEWLEVFKYLFENRSKILATDHANDMEKKKAKNLLLAAVTKHTTTQHLTDWIGFYTTSYHALTADSIQTDMVMRKIIACLESIHRNSGIFTCGWDVSIFNSRLLGLSIALIPLILHGEWKQLMLKI